MIKIGDRIRFLNEVGGGIVTKIIDKNLVSVLDEDGFEIPVLQRECVVIETPKASVTNVEPKLDFNALNTEQNSTNNTFDYEPEPDTMYGEQLNIYFAFVPTNLKQLSISAFDFHLINDSNYNLLFTILLRKENELRCIEKGTITSNTKMFIDSFAKEQLQNIHDIILQCIAFKTAKTFVLKAPFDTTFALSLSDFSKLHFFKENDFFEESAMIVPLIEKDIPAAFLKIEASKIEQAIKEKEKIHSPKPTVKGQKKAHGDLIELDLHINKLLDNTTGMDNTAILQYQLEILQNTLNQYKNKRGQKIVVIHGKGEGVLRKAIIEELKTHYKGYRYQDASFREYGFGATLITIH